ncbi:MAG: Hpt domain-containing protein [Desulfobacteraceae bacterium]|nr:MAG: Hpt domain-containing protein [Desulfobacteraceae bacterium]
MNSKETIIVGNLKIIIRPDPDLADEAKWYRGQLEEYARSIRDAAHREDFQIVQEIGHRLKGSAVSFGFDEASEIGRFLEQSAKNNDAVSVKKGSDRLSDYLECVELISE